MEQCKVIVKIFTRYCANISKATIIDSMELHISHSDYNDRIWGNYNFLNEENLTNVFE